MMKTQLLTLILMVFSGKLYVNSGIIDLTSQNSKINLIASPSQISGNISYGIFGDNASSTLDQRKTLILIIS